MGKEILGSIIVVALAFSPNWSYTQLCFFGGGRLTKTAKYKKEICKDQNTLMTTKPLLAAVVSQRRELK